VLRDLSLGQLSRFVYLCSPIDLTTPPIPARRLVRNTERKPLRVFLQSGENDLDNTHGCWPLANQALARALNYAGYEHRFVFGEGWHSRIQGAHHLPATLVWLLGGGAAPKL
jgi:hypothetical protein